MRKISLATTKLTLMRMSLGRFGILAVLIIVCIGSFQTSILKTLHLGLEAVLITATDSMTLIYISIRYAHTLRTREDLGSPQYQPRTTVMNLLSARVGIRPAQRRPASLFA